MFSSKVIFKLNPKPDRLWYCSKIARVIQRVITTVRDDNPGDCEISKKNKFHLFHKFQEIHHTKMEEKKCFNF